ncbi:PhzF family phenazine biosynthesis protein [Paenibacillus hexagrammi]|uniref:PhzF family phenazine biosynthesis protein n=1 Tax=Paenibacillus hexagrammi TaxID=2908839 RepID=A0ABY3SRT0_9BACL|nr:PhzF family phenazine biosynthesis protein [Paenibacillus sp. YPD9-1]UJF35815.1 PhzF family phenazine biosynthesis protein [Paenibacillus sp. YPD9-1]
MPPVTIYHYDAFSRIPNQGNPAGVVFDAQALTAEDMQRIAAEVGFNETVFVLPSNQATVQLTYYTPGHEINLCGHATMAAVYGLKTRGMLGGENHITIETNVGILPISMEEDHQGDILITMKQDTPKFIPFQGDRTALAVSIGIDVDELDGELPILYGSTGTWTLLVPVRRLSAFQKMKPYNDRFPGILLENPKASLHPFCMETLDQEAFMHARHFSSPYSGTIEDPVTGTASGVMGAYYLAYMRPDLKNAEFVIEQGQEMGRDGRVKVQVERSDQGQWDVRISGTAVYVKKWSI